MHTLASAELPGLRRRLASMTYETLLLLGVLSVTFMVPHLLLGMAFNITAPNWLVFLNFFGVIGIYFVWYWHAHGQTLAMQTWKMQLVRTDGSKPSLEQLIIRYCLAWAIPLGMIYLVQQLLTDLPVARWYPYLGGTVGLLWAFFDRDRQFLQDRLAGTKIVFKT
jgi:uncharacterized RDD family membrane protein YckC